MSQSRPASGPHGKNDGHPRTTLLVFGGFGYFMRHRLSTRTKFCSTSFGTNLVQRTNCGEVIKLVLTYALELMHTPRV